MQRILLRIRIIANIWTLSDERLCVRFCGVVCVDVLLRLSSFVQMIAIWLLLFLFGSARALLNSTIGGGVDNALCFVRDFAKNVNVIKDVQSETIKYRN